MAAGGCGGWTGVQAQQRSALLQEGGREVNSNVYRDRKPSYRLSKTIAMLIRGRACFDFDLYRSKSADLAALPDDDALWNHFVKDGQFEGRVFRYASLPLSAAMYAISVMSSCIHAHVRRQAHASA